MAIKTTEVVKRHIQLIIKDTLGVNVSKQKAWELYKDIMWGMAELTTVIDQHNIPLAGVGKYKINHSKPRGAKAGLDKNGKPFPGMKAWDYVPHFKFYPSTAVKTYIEQLLGFEELESSLKFHGILVSEDAEDKAMLDALHPLDYKKYGTKAEVKEEKPKKKVIEEI